MIKVEKVKIKVPIGIQTRAFCATNRRTNHYTIETTTKNENEKSHFIKKRLGWESNPDLLRDRQRKNLCKNDKLYTGILRLRLKVS